jgi:tetratricopeptide (TPR) repeat protein
MDEFRRIHGENVALLERQGLAERARVIDSARIATEALVGNMDDGVALARSALAQPAPSADVLVNAGFGLLWAGRVDEGLKCVDEALAKLPSDDRRRKELDTIAKAMAALRQRRPGQAVELLDTLEPSTTKGGARFGAMLLRGEALLATGRTADAEAQYQALLDQRAREPFDLALPLAQLGLAKARARAGNTAGAVAAYDTLLASWKDADPDVPMVREARAARARLSAS